MSRTYLVKKDATMPQNADNWIVMNFKQYSAFIKTPEGTERVKHFMRIDSCDGLGTTIFAECNAEEAKDMKKDRNGVYYRSKQKKAFHYDVVSYSEIYHEDEEMNGEELLRIAVEETKRKTVQIVRSIFTRKDIYIRSQPEKDIEICRRQFDALQNGT